MKNLESKWIATDCTICYHSCGMNVLVEEGRITKVEGLKDHPLNRGRLCPKGERAIELVYHPDRLKYPLKRVNSQWKRILWDEALTEIGNALQRLKKEFGPEVLSIFSGSIGVENLEMMEMAQRFKGAFGSPNFISVEGICYRMRIRARQMTFGKYPVEEMNTQLYVLWGHNPEQSDFPLHLAIEENLAKGSKLVVIDPKKISLAKKADLYLAIRPGTDGALALALMHVIIKENLYDKDFIERWTHGFDQLVPHIEPYTPEWAEKITWVPAGDIRRLARLYAQAESASIFQGTNTQDQTANGTQNSRAFSILQTITGNINNPGGWVISPRLILTGIGLPTERTPIGAEDYRLFYEIWGRKSPYGQVVCFPDSVPNPIRALLVTGGNPLISMPDSNAFREAFKKLDLLVVHELFMTETAEMAHYVLPACSHLEKNGLAYSYNVCHGMPYLMLRKKAIEPLYESWSEFKFWSELGNKMGMEEIFPWKTDEEVIELELKSSGLNYRELKEEKIAGAYYMEKQYGMGGYQTRGFSTPSKKIEIYSETFEKEGFDPLPTYREPDQSPLGDLRMVEKYPLVLTTGARILYYTHGQHRNVEGLKKKIPEPLAEMNPKTAARFSIQEGDWIIVESNRGQIKVKAVVTEDMREGVVSIPHGWPREANVNLLTDVHCREPIMGYPQMKSQLCSVRKA
ncbi:MAG TPA: molybdopterin-dependent oxidoreductase [Thermodesulfobacteriota bacterium]|nr:molybdopterin-dependent oxidoreductase [Thermodesulfobacteriota bacterium]